jgi:hypothetical protein
MSALCLGASILILPTSSPSIQFMQKLMRWMQDLKRRVTPIHLGWSMGKGVEGGMMSLESARGGQLSLKKGCS